MSNAVTRVKVRFKVEGLGEATGELIRYLAPRTVEALLKAMPIVGIAATWKEEVYFEVPVKVGAEKAKERIEAGGIAYWPMGAAVCIFYGETRPYSPVNPVGRITDNLNLFKQVKEGMRLRLGRA